MLLHQFLHRRLLSLLPIAIADLGRFFIGELRIIDDVLGIDYAHLVTGYDELRILIGKNRTRTVTIDRHPPIIMQMTGKK